ncbi:MAG: long-chain fatty acid--CoA ligase [Bacteroidota bacterium]
MSIFTDWLSRWAEYCPEKVAISEYETGRSLTYGQAQHLSSLLAHHLTDELGLKKGDRIAVLAENCLEYGILLFVAQKTGIILVPYNYRLSSGEVAYLIEDSQPNLLVVENKFSHLLEGEKQHDRALHVWSLESLQVWLDDAADNEPLGFPPRELEEDHPVFILYTSGTTGFPKGALYTHRMLVWNSLNTSLRLDITSEDRTVNCMPLFHTGGWNVLFTPFMHHGAYLCMMKSFDAGKVLEALEKDSISIFMAVPTMLNMMAAIPEFESADVSSVRYFIVGGEAMPIPLIETWAQKGVPIRQGYGMTEVGPNLMSLHQDDAIRKKGSIGKPNFYVQTRLLKEDGTIGGPGESGELLLKGPMVTPGYWQNPEATKKTFHEGWFKTGDLLRMDEEGFFYVMDRIKNMFISGGENVYPAEVERILIQHPDIEEVAVLPVEDSKWGEVGKACIGSHAPISLEVVQSFCEGKLARFKIPKYIEIMPELPKNGTGKIDRKTLKELIHG